ncbi:hypothetical protein POJ06DRAFT_253608 [Lipomyces tetrasporus]|uniref:Tetratricopeptide repeat protein 1 n=1 Tax=Lipomyces tetrasporus TaxID=54092 RepID=A0AAD7QSU1_9ASCO|nr:uncharacterized protein POJ06DRAFT_253608 [Lipomyces tetrasporus]KAJ8100754.1 hypothetical protein POJ06DRAFT_253608 [Lipomyces tetrasporus]
MAVLETFEDTKDEATPLSADSRSESSSPPPPAERPKSETNDMSENESKEEELVRFSPEEEASLLAQSDEIKQKGNVLFADKDYETAIDKYTEALSICPKYLDHPRSVLWSNISACNAKLEKWTDTVETSTKSLKLQPKYMKPLLRRAQANERIGTWSSLQAAAEDYKLAHEISPTKETSLAMIRIQPKIEEAQKKETAEMLGKLKELGNGILRPFGLSTDMFKMQPDGKGGYSMNFSKN